MESFGFEDWPGVAVVYADQFNTEIWSLLGEARQQSPATLAPRIRSLVTIDQSAPKLLTDLAIQPLGEDIHPNKHRQIGDPHVGQVEL